MMINDKLHALEGDLAKALTATQHKLQGLRTGRAQPAMLEGLMVDYYGTATPLKGLANIAVEDARTLTVQPYDQGALSAVEKAIRDSDLGLNPATQGVLIRIHLAPLTEERRRELIKLAKAEAEHGRVRMRNIRRDGNQAFKDWVKDKSISEDERKRAEEALQKLLNQFIAEIDTALAAKEKDLLTV